MPYNAAALDQPSNQVRFLIGDTDLTEPLLSDDEIAAYLPGGFLAAATTLDAAIALLDGLIARAAFNVDTREGGAGATLSQLMPQLEKRQEQLRQQAMSANGAAAGVLASLTAPRDDGTDRAPAFTRTLGDRTGAGDWP